MEPDSVGRQLLFEWQALRVARLGEQHLEMRDTDFVQVTHLRDRRLDMHTGLLATADQQRATVLRGLAANCGDVIKLSLI